jgi:two-component system, NarL family, nitrate/nitrite response regulator NarP
MSGGRPAVPSPRQDPPIRVAIFDGRDLIAEALAALIRTVDGFAVTRVITRASAVGRFSGDTADLVIAGVGCEPRDALELLRPLSSQGVEVPIALVADELTPEVVRFVLDERLNGLILTDASVADVGASLAQVARGHAVLPAGWQNVLGEGKAEPLESLSQRQLEVLTLVAEGHSYEEIATLLFISPNTVKFHVRSIYLHLGVRNRMAAAHLLAQHRSAVGHTHSDKTSPPG